MLELIDADLCDNAQGKAAVDYFERASRIIGWDSPGEPAKMLFGAQQRLYEAACSKRKSERATHLLLARILVGRALETWEKECEL